MSGTILYYIVLLWYHSVLYSGMWPVFSLTKGYKFKILRAKKSVYLYHLLCKVVISLGGKGNYFSWMSWKLADMCSIFYTYKFFAQIVNKFILRKILPFIKTLLLFSLSMRPLVSQIQAHLYFCAKGTKQFN